MALVGKLSISGYGDVLDGYPAGTEQCIATRPIDRRTGATKVMQTGSLVTTATTADQVVLTYTVTAGKKLFLEYFELGARLTTYVATATHFGPFSLESPAATKLYTQDLYHAGATQPILVLLTEPLEIAAATVVRFVVTPTTILSFTWRANFGGYEL